MGENILKFFQVENRQLTNSKNSHEMKSSNCLDGGSDEEYILGDCQQSHKVSLPLSMPVPVPPKRPLPKTKKLRVRVKRLSRDILRRYEKKMIPISRDSSSVLAPQHPVNHIIRKSQPSQIVANKQSLKILPIKNPNIKPIIRKSITSIIEQNALEISTRKIRGNIVGKPAAMKRPTQTTLNTSNEQIKNIKTLTKEATPNRQLLDKNNITSGKDERTKPIKIEPITMQMKNKIIYTKQMYNNDGRKRALQQTSPGNNTTSLQDMERTVRKSQEAFQLKQQINGPKNNNQIIVKKQAITIIGGDNKNRDVIKATIRKGEQIKNRIRQELQKKNEITREEFRKKFVELLAKKKHEIGMGNTPVPGGADRKCDKASATKLQLNKLADSKRGPAKLVKEPTIVRVPVSKLIKIPQSMATSNTVNRQEMPKASINIVKNPEIIKLPHSIKIPDCKLFKGPETKNVPAMAKGQDIVIASKVIVNPELVKVPTKKVTELGNVSNSGKLANKPDFLNVVKKEDTTKLNSTESLKPKAAIKLTPSHQSKFVQTDKEAILKPKPANCPTKAIQTNFTFNDNICAVVDTVEFKLNCYHCSEVFSLRNWPSFIGHVKNAHRLDKYEQQTADELLTPGNIIPHGTMSREIQVNTVNAHHMLGSKRNRSIDEVQDSDLMDTLAADNTESADDENQMDDDIERVLIALDMDEDDDEMSSDDEDDAPVPSPPRKIAKFSEIKQENGEKLHPPIEMKAVKLPQISIKKIGDLTAKLHDNISTEPKVIVVPAQGGHKAAHGVKLINQPLNKNKIITLPTNMKIIKQFKVGPAEQQATAATLAKPALSSSYTNVNILNKNITSTSFIKDAPKDSKGYDQTSTSDSNKVTTKSNKTEDSLNDIKVDGTIANTAPTKIEITSESPSKCDEFEFIDTLATPETSIKNESLDICQNDVEQNVKIEPAFDVTLNNSGDETVPPKKMYEQREKPKKNFDLKKKLSSLQKPKPIPSNLLDSDDEMPSNDENEDDTPSPTNGCGILFGLTNRKIVLEFIAELQKYPELWKFNRNNDVAVNYHESVQHLCTHINEKFNIEMTEFEIRLSVQRIKYWYCRTLQKLDSHKRDQQASKKPQQQFQHTFPEYFKMLDKFLSSDSNNAKDLVLGKRFQKDDVNVINRYPKWMLYKEPAGSGVEATTDDKCSLANDLAFSEGAESDQGDEEFAASRKPFKSELDTSSAPPDPFICDICFVDFNRPMELTRHRARHFPPQYPCATCKKMHYSAYLADKCSDHAEQEKEKAPQGDNVSSSSPLYVCEICGVSYKSVGTLNYHRKDKHFHMRNKCAVCKFTSISNYRLLEHQKKRHVVEYGTCEEVAKRTRARTETKVPFNAEARREFEWRREMRKVVKPGELFYGCYRCKMVFGTRKEKIQHNREEHPITESTVICLLCKKEKALFSNTNSVRKHYTVVHKVPWHEIDDLVKNTKQLYNLLSPLEIDQLNSSENPNTFVTKILANKLLAEQKEKQLGNEISRAIKSTSEEFEKELNHTYDPFKFESNADKRLKFKKMMLPQDDDSNDDDYNQSTLYNDIGIDHDYEDMQEDSYDEDDYDEYAYHRDQAMLQRYEFQCGDSTEHYIIEEADCVVVADEFGDIDVGQPGDQQLIYDSSVVDIENGIISEDIIEEIVEYDFMDDVMEERY